MYFRLIFKELNESRKLPKSKYTINDLLDDLELSSETIVAKKNNEIAIGETEINENDEIRLIQIIYGG
ncbi:MAG: MoaD/ThiS family protein [Methanobrevibacter sp.]|nr:MoaD/ThiS family protein [Methanobrevibacter sp.]